MEKTFDWWFEETRAPAAAAAIERADKLNVFAKSAPTWAGRRTFYRAKAAAISAAITALPQLLDVPDQPADKPGIVGVVLRGLPPGLHVALDLLEVGVIPDGVQGVVAEHVEVQNSHAMPAGKKRRNQRRTDVPRSAGYQDFQVFLHDVYPRPKTRFYIAARQMPAKYAIRTAALAWPAIQNYARFSR